MRFFDKFKVVNWNIGFIDGKKEELIQSKTPYSITWMKHYYLDRFFADPFILEENKDNFIVLAEEYLFVEAKGKIVKLTIDKEHKRLIKRELLIETDFHLSYPFIYDGTIFPEQSASGKWISYTLNGEEKDVLADIGIIDGTIFDDGKNKWLFATKKLNANSELYRYKIVNGKLVKSTEMLIKNTAEASRPGGKFIKIGIKWFRVAQNSTAAIYGESLAICEVTKCDDEGYEEVIVNRLSSHNEKRFNCGLHTMNVYSNGMIVDGFEMGMRPIQRCVIKFKSILF